jgi:hypothetical protein
MSWITLLQSNFCSGEISSTMAGRLDSPQYQTGLKSLKNAIPSHGGWLYKRPGSIYRRSTRNNRLTRQIPYYDLGGSGYILEFSDGYVRAFDADHVQVGTDIASPYSVADLWDLQYQNNKGVLWLFHPGYDPRTFTISAGTPAFATPTFSGARSFTGSGNRPGMGFFYQGRLGLSGVPSRPTEFALSRAPDSAAGTDRYTDFTINTTVVDSDAIIIQMADILSYRWAIGQKRLLVATNRAMALDPGSAATPASFYLSSLARSRPLSVPGILAGNLLIYLDAALVLHAVAYSSNDESYKDIELTAAQDHILQPGVKEMAFMQVPEPILWILRTDGVLVSVALNESAGAFGPSVHPMNGGAVVESIACLEDEQGDVLFLALARGSARSIETITLPDLRTQELASCHYVDGGIIVDRGTASKTVSGLDHLEGKDVVTLGDGKVLGSKTVTGGTITLDIPVKAAHVGLPIETNIETLGTEIPSNGTSQGKIRRIEDISVRLFRSLGGELSVSGKDGEPILYLTAGTSKYGEPVPLFSGDKGKTSIGVGPDVTVKITHAAPTPFNVLAVIYRVDIMEV